MQLIGSVKPRHARGPLKTMFVITSMPVGGAETLLVNMMDRFDSRNIIPEVCCLKETGPLGEQIQDRFVVHSNLLSSKFDLRILGKARVAISPASSRRGHHRRRW